MSKFATRIGNPHHLVTRQHHAPSYAKNAMRKHVSEFRSWAAKFNLDLMAECDSLNIALSEVNLDAIPIGHTRRWELTDEPSGITLVVEVEKL